MLTKRYVKVRLLGESYTVFDEEDSRSLRIGRLWIYEARWASCHCFPIIGCRKHVG
jgi:hypothetical protein